MNYSKNDEFFAFKKVIDDSYYRRIVVLLKQVLSLYTLRGGALDSFLINTGKTGVRELDTAQTYARSEDMMMWAPKYPKLDVL